MDQSRDHVIAGKEERIAKYGKGRDLISTAN